MAPAKIQTYFRRPIDCSPNQLRAFTRIVMEGGEVPLANLQRGIPMAEVLFFTGIGNILMGVGAFRFAQAGYHRYLFAQAGVPEMYNPDSVETCWLCVSKPHRGKGVWKDARAARLAYLGNRPAHGLHRAANDLISPLVEPSGYAQAGTPFHSDTSEHLLRLVVLNHDPEYDAAKGLIYGPRHAPVGAGAGTGAEA